MCQTPFKWPQHLYVTKCREMHGGRTLYFIPQLVSIRPNVQTFWKLREKISEIRNYKFSPSGSIISKTVTLVCKCLCFWAEWTMDSKGWSNDDVSYLIDFYFLILSLSFHPRLLSFYFQFPSCSKLATFSDFAISVNRAIIVLFRINAWLT